VTVDLGPLAGLNEAEAVELACKADLGVWAERKRGFRNSALHWEWSMLAMTVPRLALVAPREHSKTEVFTVNQVAWRCTYTPGIQCFVVAQTSEQAELLKARIDAAVAETAPWLVTEVRNKTFSRYANWSQVTVGGAGKKVRGMHPDLIIGDDVLSEENSLTEHKRKQTARWWFGTVSNMAHPGTDRFVGGPSGRRVWFPPTIVHLVGTPFHRKDLLMGMRDNPMYQFRRYAAEFRPEDLVDGLAVEVA
jgi:hypothetical protein